ncbi:MAG: histidine phosphatase family protein [Syntrophales bacterium LBB04]|nr:histidine phosphatase family protein [Syntrophales bacterium LBB04]
MKTIYLLRHAKEDKSLINDMGRDLSGKGRRQAESIGQWMSENGIMPDWIISSSAKRTKATANICAKKVGYQRSVRFEDSLYHASGDTYLDIIAALNDKYESVMMVGHNPAISALVTVLTGVHLDMSPCMLACLDFTFIDKWSSVRDANGTLKWFQIPS